MKLSFQIRLAFRFLWRQGKYNLLTIGGLAIAFAVAFYIFIWVENELTYDRHFSKSENIYRLTIKNKFPNGYESHFARVWSEWIMRAGEKIPEIESSVRMQLMRQSSVNVDGHKFYSSNIYRTDSAFFEVFGVKLLEGDPNSVLNARGQVVISEKSAKKYFSDGKALGKSIKIAGENEGKMRDYVVTGVFENLPANSHFDLDMLTSLLYPKQYGWSYFYVLLNKNTDIGAFKEKLQDYKNSVLPEQNWDQATVVAQGIADIHLFSHKDREIKQNGNIWAVWIMIGIGLIIVLVALVNFVNLSVALLYKESRFLITCKILGAGKMDIFGFQLWKTLLILLFTWLASLLLIEIARPGMQMILPIGSESDLISINLLLLFLALSLLTLIVGLYPASIFIATKFSANSLFGQGSTLIRLFQPGKRMIFRKVLLVVQFSAAIILICLSVFSRLQQDFLMKSTLNNDAVVVLKKMSVPVRDKYKVLKNELMKSSLIKDVSAAMEAPLDQVMDAVGVKGHSPDEAENVNIYINLVDDNFFQFNKIEIIAGDSFKTSGENPNYDYILNESAIRALGYMDPDDVIGKELLPEPARPGIFEDGKIIGVVKDFNLSSLHHKIKPLAFYQNPRFFMSVSVKLNPDRQEEALAYLQEAWEKINPDYPLDYNFLENVYGNVYQKETSQSRLSWILTLIAIAISFVGLYALSSIIMEQKTKETGIRKVLGLSVSGLILKQCSDFLLLVLIAVVVSLPVVILILQNWLNNFAYSISLSAHYYVLIFAALITAIFVALVVGIKTWFVASRNPVDSLRYE
jgi:putative ABC transport system permease protein